MTRHASELEPQEGFRKHSNPLLDALGPRINYYSLPIALENNSLRSLSSHTSFDEREDILSYVTTHFFPTSDVVDITASLQDMFREGYLVRDLRNPEMRKKLYTIASFRDMREQDIPWFPEGASGMIIKGITGLRKSTTVLRYLSRLPQVVQHDDVDGMGWRMTQLVWLKVDMSSDGTRGGFALNIMSAVDRVLGTNYHDQYSRGKPTVEKLLVRVGIILSSHACGLLVIDEIQDKNFNQSDSRDVISNFFLRWMNFGIPTVLIGNPLGFIELQKLSQNERRMTRGGCYYLWPYEESETIWNKEIIPGIWEYDVMPVPTPLTPAIEKALFEYSGGIFDYAMRLRVESQRIALRLQQRAVSLEHMQQAFLSGKFAGRDLIHGLVSKDINYIVRADIPVDDFRQRWQTQKRAMESVKKDEVTDNQPASTAPTIESQENRHKRSKVKASAQLKREQTSSLNRAQKNKELEETISNADMRNGIRAESMTHMDMELESILAANSPKL